MLLSKTYAKNAKIRRYEMDNNFEWNLLQNYKWNIIYSFKSEYKKNNPV